MAIVSVKRLLMPAVFVQKVIVDMKPTVIGIVMVIVLVLHLKMIVVYAQKVILV